MTSIEQPSDGSVGRRSEGPTADATAKIIIAVAALTFLFIGLWFVLAPFYGGAFGELCSPAILRSKTESTPECMLRGALRIETASLSFFISLTVWGTGRLMLRDQAERSTR